MMNDDQNLETQAAPPKSGKSGLAVLVGGVAIAVVALAVAQIVRTPAPTPPALADAAMTEAEISEHGGVLEAALAKSDETGKPVLAIATADWCPPCQELKRGALADASVDAFISESFIPVSLDFTDRNNADMQKYAATLQISGIPAMLVIDDDRVIARRSGNAPRLSSWHGGHQSAVAIASTGLPVSSLLAKAAS
ncbi:MAG: thioredoxin family protein, partial [Planctomycetota bacterium]